MTKQRSLSKFPQQAPLKYKTQPPWEFRLAASRNSLQSYELSRLSHAANLRKEITQLLDSWLEENSAAMLARWLRQNREGLSAGDSDPLAEPQDGEPRAHRSHSVSDNFFADEAACPPQLAPVLSARARFPFSMNFCCRSRQTHRCQAVGPELCRSRSVEHYAEASTTCDSPTCRQPAPHSLDRQPRQQ